MNKINFLFERTIITKSHDAAIVLGNEDPRQALVDAAIQTLSTDVEITVDGVTMHLAAWMDPDHWSSDWEEKGIEDVDDFVAEAITQE